MSAHYKFEVHAVTRGEDDKEQDLVEDLAQMTELLGRAFGRRLDMHVKVTEVERT